MNPLLSDSHDVAIEPVYEEKQEAKRSSIDGSDQIWEDRDYQEDILGNQEIQQRQTLESIVD
jgi:hypothetical protein